jgi:hypothetical protein
VVLRWVLAAARYPETSGLQTIFVLHSADVHVRKLAGRNGIDGFLIVVLIAPLRQEHQIHVDGKLYGSSVASPRNPFRGGSPIERACAGTLW